MTATESLAQASIPLLGHLDCDKCSLSRTRTNVVPGYGNPNARLVICGEAPGKEEDEQGRPFVGPSGKLLRGIMEGMGLSDTDFFWSNIFHCRPPSNQISLAKDSMCPRIWLAAELATIRPHVILAVGRTANDWLRPETKQLSMRVAQAKDTYDSERRCWVVCTYHPSYLLRQQHTAKGNVILVSMVNSLQRCVYYLRDMEAFPPEETQ